MKLQVKPKCSIGQGFAANATSSYVKGGLKGHPGVDSSCGYDSKIDSYWDKEYVYKILTVDNPANDGSGFTGVFTIVEQDGQCFEFLYGHCNPAPNLLGKWITKGSHIGTEANNGLVFNGGFQITLEMQKEGDRRGSHRHDQARQLRKALKRTDGVPYLTGLGGGVFNLDNYFYEIVNFNNGYNGCFDWTSYLPSHREFTKEMKYLDFNTDVQKLQAFFIRTGYMMPVAESDFGWYGKKTAVAIKKFMVDTGTLSRWERLFWHGMTVGPKTLKALNQVYK